jgi:hypothetical protein
MSKSIKNKVNPINFHKPQKCQTDCPICIINVVRVGTPAGIMSKHARPHDFSHLMDHLGGMGRWGTKPMKLNAWGWWLMHDRIQS